MKRLVAPSILSADFSHLADEIRKIEDAGADILHLDIMDGHLVPNITIGPSVVESIRKNTRLTIDCHLMIENPEKYIEHFAKAGADWISVHVEACDLAKLLPAIKKLGVKAGAVIDAQTPAEKILPYLHLCDFVLVMTVRAGFGGQKIMPDCIDKALVIKEFCEENKIDAKLEMDGGINPDTIAEAARARPDIIVAGSAVFHSKDYKKAIDALR